MPLVRRDKFLRKLKALKDEYKEYAEVLEFLIEEIKKGRHEQIQKKIKQLKRNNW